MRPLVDLERLLRNEAGGIDADAVFVNLTPEQRTQAYNQAAQLMRSVEQGAPFSATVGQSTPVSNNVPTISSIEEFNALPDGAIFVAPNGTRWRKNGENADPVE